MSRRRGTCESALGPARPTAHAWQPTRAPCPRDCCRPAFLWPSRLCASRGSGRKRRFKKTKEVEPQGLSPATLDSCLKMDDRWVRRGVLVMRKPGMRPGGLQGGGLGVSLPHVAGQLPTLHPGSAAGLPDAQRGKCVTWALCVGAACQALPGLQGSWSRACGACSRPVAGPFSCSAPRSLSRQLARGRCLPRREPRGSQPGP